MMKVEGMATEKEKSEEQLAKQKKLKKSNRQAVWCFVLSIVSWPLCMTGVLWIPSLIASVVIGVKAIKQHNKNKLIIAGLVMDFVLALAFILLTVGIMTNSELMNGLFTNLKNWSLG